MWEDLASSLAKLIDAVAVCVDKISELLQQDIDERKK